MNSVKNFLLLIVLLLAHSSFAQNKETRRVSSFNKLEAGGSLDIIIEEGSENIITIESRGIDPAKIITEVKDEVLKVYLEEGNYRNIKGTIYITYKNLEEIRKSGSGNLRSKSDLSGPEFKFSASGSGNTISQGNIRAQHLSIKTSGSGNVKLASIYAEDFDLSMSGSGNFDVASGSVSNISIDKSGSGDIEAFGLNSEVCTVSKSGSGNINISASQSLEARMSGSGNINYKGNASVRKIKHSGSGEINMR